MISSGLGTPNCQVGPIYLIAKNYVEKLRFIDTDQANKNELKIQIFRTLTDSMMIFKSGLRLFKI